MHGQAAVKRILATARDVGPKGDDLQFGAGLLDAGAAVAGLGSAGDASGGGGATAPKAKVSVRRTQKIAGVRSKGIAVRCRAAEAGTCKARATRRETTVARGAAKVPAGATATLAVKLTKAGRKAVSRAKRVRVKLRVSVPGGRPRTVDVVLKR